VDQPPKPFVPVWFSTRLCSFFVNSFPFTQQQLYFRRRTRGEMPTQPLMDLYIHSPDGVTSVTICYSINSTHTWEVRFAPLTVPFSRIGLERGSEEDTDNFINNNHLSSFPDSAVALYNSALLRSSVVEWRCATTLLQRHIIATSTCTY
jgi:hypothetical protein